MKSVINLIQTPQGYSIVEDNVEVNKTASKASKQKSYSLSKKFVQQNFTIYPYIPNKEADNHKYLLLPARSLWFNLNQVHEIEKKALPEWFKIKKGILATMSNIKLEKHQELYKRYRNYIIELGKDQYITPSQSRKGLAGDACAIIRIHKFLEKWGLINYIHRKPSPTNEPEKQKQQKSNVDAASRKDCFDKDKLIVTRSYGKDDLQLLKKITRKFRPLCQFCQGLCGIVWYQYTDSIQLKSLSEIEGTPGKIITNSENTTEYKLVLCANCFYEGNFPLIFTFEDFVKKGVLDGMQEESGHESEKKKSNEQNKVADAIEKNKFKIKKTAEQLKMTQEYLFKVLMTMPIQKLEKISRIEVETDAEPEEVAQKKEVEKEKQKQKPTENKKQAKEKSLVQRFTREVQNLEHQEREVYQMFFQSWMLMINTKLERLREWQQGVSTHFQGAVRLQKNMLASKIQSLCQNLTK